MKQTYLNDKLIIEMIEKAKNSDNKDKIDKYIQEVTERCVSLCYKGETLRVLNEYKIMIENLKNELGL